MAPNDAAGSRKRVLPVVDRTTGADQACTTCRSNEWIWDEEVELVRAMNAVKQRVREARRERDDSRVALLRAEFWALRSRMEKARRARLDYLGHFEYD